MKKILSLLLVVLLFVGIVAYAGAAFAQDRDRIFRLTATIDDSETPAAEAMPSAEGEPGASDTAEEEPGTAGTAEEEPETTEVAEGEPEAADEDVSADPDFSAMTPQQLYEYLIKLESDEEVDAFLNALTPEQQAALDAYILSISEPVPKVEREYAADYTHAAPLKDPVDVTASRLVGKLAMQTMTTPAPEDDGLVLDKTVSGNQTDGYKLTIEAYATGEVHITTAQKPVPADIILVLDLSLSMDGDIISGYAVKTFNKNFDVYDYVGDLFVKVDGQYYPVTITRTPTDDHQNPKYQYFYSYTVGTSVQTYTSDENGSNDSPPAWTFYRYSTVSRLAALKTAASHFIDSIETKANSGDGVDHRIAVVTYSTSASIISGNKNTNGAFVSVNNNSTGIDALQGEIADLDTISYTRSDLGLQKAKDVFQNDPPDNSGLRNRVVVFFTDGAPASSGNGSFQESVANPAIANAKTLKASVAASGYGVTVYSIGIFDGANPTTTIGSASNENKFMHFVSSNYPNATSMSSYDTGSNAGYYLSASNTTGLNNIFQSISENIETGETTVTLDGSAVMKDMIAPYFRLPAGASVNSIQMYTASAGATANSWLPREPFNGTVTISDDRKTVGVSGFNYAENYYAAIETNGTITGYKGKKLIIEIPIEYIPGSCFGGTVPTNELASGIYKGRDLVKALPIPTVDIPVNYDFTPENQSIYLTQNAMLNGMFTTAAGYVADGVNNAYVDIVYALRSGGGTVLGTYTIRAGDSQADGEWDISHFELEGLTANTGLTVDCTVTTVNGTPASITLSKPVTVYVFTPEVTWRDSVIWLGETADYADNLHAVVWNNTAGGVPLPLGAAPSLTYQYNPAAADFTQDTHVGVTVNIGGSNVTPYTHLVHQDCSIPGCGYNAALGQFMVHVKSCAMTITKQGAADTTDTFIFKVTGGGRELYVSVQGNGSQTIVGLPVGSYTITELGSWSWRYTAGEETVTLGADNAAATVTVGNTIANDKWLGGDSHAVNTFLSAD